MATRDVFSADELAQLRGFPEIGRAELIRFFMLTPADEEFIRRFRDRKNMLGAAVQLCTLPWLGFVPDDVPAAPATAVARKRRPPIPRVRPACAAGWRPSPRGASGDPGELEHRPELAVDGPGQAQAGCRACHWISAWANSCAQPGRRHRPLGWTSTASLTGKVIMMRRGSRAAASPVAPPPRAI